MKKRMIIRTVFFLSIAFLSTKNFGAIDTGVTEESKAKQLSRKLFSGITLKNADLVQKAIRGGADVNDRVYGNKTALIIAAGINNNLEVVKVLVENRAAINAQDESYNTPLITAARLGYEDIVKYLLENGANRDIKDIYGKTAFDYAKENGHIETAFLLENQNIVEILEESKVKQVSRKLFSGIMLKNADLVQKAIEAGADVNDRVSQGYDNKTALIIAAGIDNLEVVKVLVENGAAINAQDESDNTPLITAARLGYEDIVKYLLENGANSDMKDIYGKTAFDYAKENGHETIVSILKDHEDQMDLIDIDYE